MQALKDHSCIDWATPLLLAATVFAGCFVRFYSLRDVYEEYDDVGVIALYKSQATREAKTYPILRTSALALNVTTDAGIMKKLLDTPFFAAYIAYGWTYPPGQYFFFPFLINERHNYHEKLVRGRAFSAAVSCVGLFLVAYLLYLLAGRRVTPALLLPVGLQAFSFNSVLYAHHMSPYSMVVASLVLELILFYAALKERIPVLLFFCVLGVLSYFNYLTLLALPVFVLLLGLRYGICSRQMFRKGETYKILAGIVLYFLIFLPCLVLFLKPGRGMQGDLPPTLEAGFPTFLWYFLKQFFLAASSTLASFSQLRWVNVGFAGLVVLGGLIIWIRQRKALSTGEKYLCAFAFIFLLEWVVLHARQRIVMAESRHVLIWLPLLCLLFFVWLSHVRFAGGAAVLRCLAALLIILGTYQNITLLRSKAGRFDFDALSTSPIDTIVTYEGTLAPLAYFEGKKRVFLDASGTFQESYEKLGLPEKVLLVSQDIPLSAYRRSEMYRRNIRFFNDYNVKVLTERPSGIYFPFNNSKLSSSQNGFYLYELTKKRTGR